VQRWFDTSNYDKDHPSGIPTGKNKKVVGMMKDEYGENKFRNSLGCEVSYMPTKWKKERKKRNAKE
jgi:hypothetical protein